MSKYMVCDLIDPVQSPEWDKVNAFLLKCGSAHDPKQFASEIIANAIDLCSFERALVFFIDGNGKSVDQHLHNFSQEYLNDYLSVYGYQEGSDFSLRQDHREKPDQSDLILIKWQEEPETSFIKNYVRPQKLSRSLSMIFYDLYGNYRTILVLDRMEKRKFSEKELRNLYYCMPHLNNLHKNFFYNADIHRQSPEAFTTENSVLTRREAEIANLMCQGISPANVSKSLYISKATTYKHIANIYEKLGISSQRELLALMLSK